MGGLQADPALLAGDPQMRTALIQFGQAVGGVLYGQPAQNLTAPIHEASVVVGMAPINAEKDLPSASCECGGAEALSGGRGDSVPVKALAGLTALDGDTGSTWGDGPTGALEARLEAGHQSPGGKPTGRASEMMGSSLLTRFWSSVQSVQ